MSESEYGEPSEEWEMEYDGDGYLINGIIRIPHCYEEHHADAHLIHAVKDLLAACEALLVADDQQDHHAYDAAVLLAEAAVTKAKRGGE